jgi:hypothetical protein
MWIRHHSPAGRWVMLVAVLGSGLVVLDGTTVVNVALSAIGQDLGASLTGLQRIVNAYTITAGMSAIPVRDPAPHLSCPLDAPPSRGFRRRG